jgi:hypothetical protein
VCVHCDHVTAARRYPGAIRYGTGTFLGTSVFGIGFSVTFQICLGEGFFLNLLFLFNSIHVIFNSFLQINDRV